MNVPPSPSTSGLSGFGVPSRPGTGQHMSPGHALPTGMANLEKSETIPEIQMPSMASLDPNFLGTAAGADHAYYTSLPMTESLLM